MKYLLASITASLLLSTASFAGDGNLTTSVASSYNSMTGVTTVTTTRSNSHRDSKTCWQATGNWVGGASFKSCAFNSGGSTTEVVYIKDKETKSE
jgi:uncharacterized hydantoinase/oxoprolinase family protein